ncbi:MAG: hypothetical protein V2B15_14280 [Bacteroidota bacterium]
MRIVKILLVILTITSVKSSFSQQLDRLVYFSDLSFGSVYEEMVFAQIEKNQDVDLKDLFLAIDVASESEAGRYKAKLGAIINQFEQEKIADKKEKKKVRIIYEGAHASLMTLYEEDALFPDLFRNGEFNCVTGTIVYSILFSDFDIPYSIQKGMNHVNLVVYPGSHTILVESTDAEKGVNALGISEKETYVDNLSRGKLIPQDKAVEGNISEIFMQYAFKESQIDEYELASRQYSNRGIFQFRELQYNKAFMDFEKAFYLKPCIELANMLLQSGWMVLHMSQYHTISDVELLIKMSRYREFGITDEDILSEFVRITEKVFKERHDLKNYEKGFNLLSKNLESKELIREISLVYYGVIIEDLLNDAKLNATLEYLDNLYELDPENKQIQILIKDILISLFNSDLISPLEQKESLDYYRDKFPLVYEMPVMKLVDLGILLTTSEYWFSQKNPTKGSQSLAQFEMQIQFTKDVSLLSREISSAYQTAAFYYYNHGNIRKTREYLDRGIKVLPNSHSLRNMRNSI